MKPYGLLGVSYLRIKAFGSFVIKRKRPNSFLRELSGLKKVWVPAVTICIDRMIVIRNRGDAGTSESGKVYDEIRLSHARQGQRIRQHHAPLSIRMNHFNGV